MPPTTHSKLGASKAERWMNCPGSVAAEADLPDSTSFYALEGTGAHELAEWCLNSGKNAYQYPKGTITVFEGEEKHEITVDEEMEEAVQVFVAHVRGLQSPGDLLLVEQRFDLSPLNPPEPMFGTSDASLWKPTEKHLHVCDYKHGAGVAVDAEENWQLRYYALGAVLELRKRPDLITVWIVQPRGFHPAGPIRSETFTFEELVGFKAELFAKAAATQDPDAPRAVGDWCRFCKAMPICPKQRQNAIEVAQTEFDVLPEFSPPDASELTPEQLTRVLERGDQVINWIRSIEGHVIHLLDTGTEVPGYKLIEGRANRRWKDEEAAEKYLANKGLKLEERMNMKLVSPAQAEKALKKAGTLGSARKLPVLIEKPAGKPKLAPADHKAPALLPSAIHDFDIPSEPNTTA